MALAVAASLLTAAPARAAAGDGRYSLAGGCYSLESQATGATIASSQRMQATALGRYLIYGPARDFLAAGPGGAVTRAAQPSPAAEWRVRDGTAGAFTLSPASAPDQVLSVSFKPADGCAVYPEAELGATGTPFKGATAYGEVRGYIDGHMHWMTFENLGGNFHCGRPWHAYGIPYALPDCAGIEGPQGAAAPIQNFLNFGLPVAPHDTTGWPKLTSWARDNLTYEGTYYRWLERAWMGGLRLTVVPINDNRVLCQLMANRRTNCDEMSTVRRGIEGIERLQDYVDAQAGGPGKGFFQLVRDPFEARRVINSGRMAVVLEIEVSELFGCRGYATSTCDRAQIDRSMDEFYDRGVRSMLLLNKYDNPLTGVRMDGGELGVVLNVANKNSSGTFWDARTCTGPERDNTLETVQPDASAAVSSGLAAFGIGGGTLPAYPPAPHCNARGLTELGRYALRRLMSKRIVVNPDHMSQKAVDETLTLAEANRYSGVISPHGWMDRRNWPRIWALGGMAFPNAGASTRFVDEWRKNRPASSPYYLGWGWGADLGGLAAQGAPRAAGSQDLIGYPFKSFDGGVTLERQRTGERVFDYRTEGVAHYGLYPDWVEDVRRLAGDPIVRDLSRGAEAYLQMWERTVGVRGPGCRSPRERLTTRGLGGLRLGLGPETLLWSAGQPQRRGRVWSYCVRGRRGAVAAAVFGADGRVALVATYRVRNGRARIVGMATRTTGATRKALLSYLRRHPRTVEPPAPLVLNPAAEAGASAAARTAAFELVCGLTW